MPRGGARIGAGRPHGSSKISKIRRLQIGRECERIWRYGDREYLRACRVRLDKAWALVLMEKRRLKAEVKRTRRRNKWSYWSPMLQQLWDEMEDQKEWYTRAKSGLCFTRPYRFRGAVLSCAQSDFSERFGIYISVRMVRECWAEWRAFELRTRHFFD